MIFQTSTPVLLRFGDIKSEQKEKKSIGKESNKQVIIKY